MDCRHFKGTLSRITEFTGAVENIPRFVGTTHGMQIAVEVVPISEITAEAETREYTEPASAEFNPVSRRFTFGIPKGTPGQQGTTPHIGDNHHWYIGDVDTGIVAEGQDGEDGDDGITPHIGSNLHWWIGDVDTGIVAEGQDGYTPVKGIDYFMPEEIEEIEDNAAEKADEQISRLYMKSVPVTAHDVDMRNETPSKDGCQYGFTYNEGHGGWTTEAADMSSYFAYGKYTFTPNQSGIVSLKVSQRISEETDAGHAYGIVSRLNVALSKTILDTDDTSDIIWRGINATETQQLIIGEVEAGQEYFITFKYIKADDSTDAFFTLFNFEIPGGYEKRVYDNATDREVFLRDLEQDETHQTVTKAQKDSWNSKANRSDIPSRLSQLDDDSQHRTVTDEQIEQWNEGGGGIDPSLITTEINDDSTDLELPTAAAVRRFVLSLVGDNRIDKVADVLGDGTYLIINYTDWDIGEYTLQNVFEGKTVSGVRYKGYYDISDRDVSTVKNVKIITDSNHVITANDFAYIKNSLTSLSVLDITTADTIENSIPAGTFRGDTHIKYVKLPDNMTLIGDNAFRESAVASVYAPLSVCEIGDSAFEGCASLKVLSAPYAVQIGYKACYNSSVEYVNTPNAKTVVMDDNNDSFAFYTNTVKAAVVGMPEDAACNKYVGQTNILWMCLDGTDSERTTIPTGIIEVSNSSNSKAVYATSPAFFAEMKALSVPTYPMQGTIRWASADGDGAERFGITINGEEYHLSNFGMGDFPYSFGDGSVYTYTANDVGTLPCAVTDCVLYRSLLDSVNGDYEVPAVSVNNSIIAPYCFYRQTAYIPSKGELLPKVILSDNVKRVEAFAFDSCQLSAVQGDGVIYLGRNAFQESMYLRWAKFPRAAQYGTQTIKVGSYNRGNMQTFLHCTRLMVLETSVPDSKLNTSFSNYQMALEGCSDFLYWIMHTETVASNTTYMTSIPFLAFDNNGNASTLMPHYRVIWNSGTNNPANTNYYGGLSSSGKTISLDAGNIFTADQYAFASDTNDRSKVSVFTSSDGWRLGDIGYGDYICGVSADGTEATLLATFLNQNTNGGVGTRSGSEFTYTTPAYTGGLNPLPITAIANKAYYNVYMFNCNLLIAEPTQSIGQLAFCGGESGGGATKWIKTVNLNGVRTVGNEAFRGINTLTAVTTSENSQLSALGTNTFYDAYNSLQTLTMHTPNQVTAGVLFKQTPVNLTVYVTRAIYDSYYRDLGTWSGINTALSGSLPHFAIIGE